MPQNNARSVGVRMGDLILVGGGGHALVVADAASAQGWRVVGVLDDDAGCVAVRRLGVERLGTLGSVWSGRLPGGRLMLALGDLSARAAILRDAGRAPGPGWAGAVVHPSAWVSPSASLGEGVFVGAGAVVQSFARLEPHAIVNTGAIVEHECVVGQNAHVAPGAVLAGRVRVGAGTLVGVGARVLPNLSIGDASTVGAGAVVTRDVPGGVCVVGMPARPPG